VRACTTRTVVPAHATRQARAVVRRQPTLGGLAAAMKPSIVFLLMAVLSALGLGACGESTQDKAKTTVCDARADISKQVDQLKGLTVSTVTVSKVQNSLKAISSDLSKIKDAQGDLSGDRRQQVQDATKTFTSQVQSIVGSVGKSTSLSEAKAQLTSALQQLGDAYKQSFAKVDC
jgi:membrane peptidoglycan carboxypeptidase